MYPSNIILTEDGLKKAVEYFLTKKAFAFDIESQGLHREVPHLNQVTWLSLATEGMAVVIPFGHSKGDNLIGKRKEPRIRQSGKTKGQTYNKTIEIWDEAPQQLDASVVFSYLRPLFESKTIIKIGHDVLFDIISVQKYLGFLPPPPYGDTKIGYWLLDENKGPRFGLKDWIKLRYGFDYDKEEIGKCVESHSFSTVAFYNYCDSKYAWLSWKWIVGQLQEQNLVDIYNLEIDVLSAVIGMRLAGARVDTERLLELREVLSKKLVEAEANIYKAAGDRFNLNSVPQRQEILYGPKPKGQGLRPWKLTAGGKKKADEGRQLDIHDYSTDDSVLESYPDNAVTSALREYGDINKLLSTYVDSWLGTDEKETIIYDDHIYAGFQQYGTVTGRFSCRKPNLQNIPRPSSELGRLVRGVFIAEPRGRLVVADYSQIELVVLAHYVGQGALYEGFLRGIDPHTMTAAMVLGKDPADVSKVERQDLGKTLGFAVVYGAGLGKVASMAHVTVPRAKEILATHAEMFPEIHGFKEDVINLARTRAPVPYITTLLGRRRRIPELNSRIQGVRLGAERQMFNSLIQGGAADLIKKAMTRLDKSLPEEIKLILQVHDELVLSCPENLADEAASLLQEAMTGEGIQKLVRVPLKAEVHTVSRWAEAK